MCSLLHIGRSLCSVHFGTLSCSVHFGTLSCSVHFGTLSCSVIDGIAEKAGLQVGDMLLKVNDDDVMMCSVEEVAKLILAGRQHSDC